MKNKLFWYAWIFTTLTLLYSMTPSRAADSFIGGFDFSVATGLQSGASLNDLTEQARFGPAAFFPSNTNGLFDQYCFTSRLVGTTYKATLAPGGIGTENLSNGCVTGGKIALSTITISNMANDSVGSNQLVDASVHSNHLSSDALALGNMAIIPYMEYTMDAVIITNAAGITNVSLIPFSVERYDNYNAYDTTNYSYGIKVDGLYRVIANVFITNQYPNVGYKAWNCPIMMLYKHDTNQVHTISNLVFKSFGVPDTGGGWSDTPIPTFHYGATYTFDYTGYFTTNDSLSFQISNSKNSIASNAQLVVGVPVAPTAFTGTVLTIYYVGRYQ